MRFHRVFYLEEHELNYLIYYSSLFITGSVWADTSNRENFIMPLFDYECEYCKKHIEAILPVSRCDDIQFCPACGELAHKIIVQGHGGIFRKGDASTWVREAAKVLTDDERPNPNLESVDDFRRYLDQNPNVRPLESHPSIPSRYGDDLFVKPDLAQQAKERSRKGHETIRKMRSITLNSAGRA